MAYRRSIVGFFAADWYLIVRRCGTYLSLHGCLFVYWYLFYYWPMGVLSPDNMCLIVGWLVDYGQPTGGIPSFNRWHIVGQRVAYLHSMRCLSSVDRWLIICRRAGFCYWWITYCILIDGSSSTDGQLIIRWWTIYHWPMSDILMDGRDNPDRISVRVPATEIRPVNLFKYIFN